jgi:hypothetical protein
MRWEYSVNDWIEFDVYSGQFERPSDCSNCGQPFPLTLSRIQAAQELASELEGLTEEERKLLAKSIPDLLKDSPNTTVAVTRFKKLIAKVKTPVTNGFKDILWDVLKEGVKQAIWKYTYFHFVILRFGSGGEEHGKKTSNRYMSYMRYSW